MRALVGTNVDIAGRIRGTIGIGYSIRNYDAPIYKTVRGLSIESNVQLFPLERFTITGTGQRTIEDASLSRSSYWDTRFSLRGDYELLRNLVLNAVGEYSHQSYLQSPLSGNVYRLSMGGRYLSSHRFNITATVRYSHRSYNNSLVEGPVGEARADLGVTYQL